MRSVAPSDPLSDLIAKRTSEIRQHVPTIMVTKSCCLSGVETSDEFLSIGMALYVDSIAAQIRAPLDAEQTGIGTGITNRSWSRPDSNGEIVVELVQPEGPASLPLATNIVGSVSIPVYQRDAVLQIIRSDGNQVDPQRPLFCRARAVWPLMKSELPVDQPVYVDVTVLFAVQCETKAKT